MARKSREEEQVSNGSGESFVSALAAVAESAENIPKKRASFKRLASIRVSRAIDAMTQLSHLTNTASYDWEHEDATKILDTLRSKVDEVEAAFIAAKHPLEKKAKDAKQLSFTL